MKRSKIGHFTKRLKNVAIFLSDEIGHQKRGLKMIIIGDIVSRLFKNKHFFQIYGETFPSTERYLFTVPKAKFYHLQCTVQDILQNLDLYCIYCRSQIST
jgi:hypothetical protein